MNASSTGSSCKEVAGGAAGAQTGLSGMLDSPKDMKAYVQAYFAQMAGMQKTHIYVYYIIHTHTHRHTHTHTQTHTHTYIHTYVHISSEEERNFSLLSSYSLILERSRRKKR